MRIILVAFVMLGFASPQGNEWRRGVEGLLNRPTARNNYTNTVPKSTDGGHTKFGIQTLPQAGKSTSASLLSSENQFFNITTSKSALRDYIQNLADSLRAEIGVAFRDLETGKEFFFNERQMMHAASTMKVPVMIEVFRQAERGKFRLDDLLLVKNEFKSIVDGSPYSLEAGDDSDSSMYRVISGGVAIRQLVEQMITVSSNLATNLLIELIDVKNVLATLRGLGIHHMQVRRGVEDGKAYQRGWNNQTDAFDMMLALQAIAEKGAASPTACDSMLAILRRQKFRDGIPAGLPSGTVVGNKTGSITKIAHDCAIVFPNFEFDKTQTTDRKPYVLVVLTKGIQEEKTAHNIIANISRRIYDGLMTSL
jgi:beta-lactamase class A